MTRGREVKEISIVTRLERKLYRREIWHEPDGTMIVVCDPDDEGAEASSANPDGPEAAAIIRELARQVEVAAVIFEEYGRLHRKKGTREGDLKAERNEQYAAEMRATLTRVQVESSDD
jgi:hypothetical protein